mgnify:CR=1 FL=1
MMETSEAKQTLQKIDSMLHAESDPTRAAGLLRDSAAAIGFPLCAAITDVSGHSAGLGSEERRLMERFGWPVRMINRWFSRAFVRQHPIYLRCRFENSVFWVQHEEMWKSLEPLTPAQEQMRTELEEFGLFGTVVAPVHLALGRTGAVVWATQKPQNLESIVTLHASVIRSIAYRIMEILVPDVPLRVSAQDLSYLTDRQIDCLSWIARGKTIAETAQILDLSIHTVREHLREITRRLNASNTTQAVALACELGIVKPLLKEEP